MSKPSPITGITRRSTLTGSAAVLAGMSLTACDALSTEPEGSSDSNGSGATDAKESPDLAAQVKSGDLPALAKRLPDEPLVVEPVEGPGSYGGTLRGAVTGTGDDLLLYTVIGYEPLLRWTVEWTGATGTDELTPNVVTGYDVNAEATEFTFSLRPGMKWSDGTPFTADDLVFTVEDVLLNAELHPVPPPFIAPTGQPPSVEAVDEVTARITFAEPAGLFLQQLATPVGGGNHMTLYPRHYLEKFHSAYAEDIDTLVQDEGFEDWVELFGSKGIPVDPRLQPRPTDDQPMGSPDAVRRWRRSRIRTQPVLLEDRPRRAPAPVHRPGVVRGDRQPRGATHPDARR